MDDDEYSDLEVEEAVTGKEQIELEKQIRAQFKIKNDRLFSIIMLVIS